MSYALLLPWVECTPPELFLLLHEHPTVFKIHTAPTERVPSIVAKRLARRSALGRCRVQIPGQRWAFFRGFPTASPTRRLLDPSVPPTTFLPHVSSPYPSSWLKKRWKSLQFSIISSAYSRRDQGLQWLFAIFFSCSKSVSLLFEIETAHPIIIEFI